MTDISAAMFNATAHVKNPNADLTKQEVESTQEFEKVFLTQFVDEMMKTVNWDATGGKETDMWRSFLSEALADSISDRGGLGIAYNIQTMMTAYQTAKNIDGGTS